jgi:serine/threonine protein kinase
MLICTAGIVHRDLAARNILLADGGDMPLPKVADFGLSRVQVCCVLDDISLLCLVNRRATLTLVALSTLSAL